MGSSFPLFRGNPCFARQTRDFLSRAPVGVVSRRVAPHRAMSRRMAAMVENHTGFSSCTATRNKGSIFVDGQ
jgi:hypothetical protein